MKKRFPVEQIVSVMKQSAVGVPVAELIRKERHGCCVLELTRAAHGYDSWPPTRLSYSVKAPAHFSQERFFAG